MSHDDIPLDAIMLDPERNVSRGKFVAPPSHPDVQKIMETLRSEQGAGRLLHCVGIFKIEPVSRPCGKGRQCCPPGATGEHAWACCYGFRRLVALRAVGRTALIGESSEYKDLTGATEAELLYHNASENMAKGSLSDAETATCLAEMCRVLKASTTELAIMLGEKDVEKVDTLVRIANRLPEDVFAAYRRKPVASRRRALAQISRIDDGNRMDVEKRHELMREQWAAYEAEEERQAEQEKAQAQAEAANPDAAPLVKRIKAQGGKAAWHSTKKWAKALDQAQFLCDPITGDWRPMDEGERAYLRGLMGAIIDGKDPSTSFR